MDVIETIKSRHSVRTFVPEFLRDKDFNSLKEYCARVLAPFEGNSAVDLRRFDLQGPQRPGTYGTISGASSYFLVSADDDVYSLMAAGFKGEELVLRCTAAGLGTCWLSGTFRHSDFDVLPQAGNRRLIAIIAVGYPASSGRLRERFTRIALGSRHRRAFDSLFFENDFSTPLSIESRFGKALDMLRPAPSSVNSQPWRALVCGNSVHFYCKQKSDINILDCGIGLSHFNEVLRSEGVIGCYKAVSGVPECEGLRYLISYLS